MMVYFAWPAALLLAVAAWPRLAVAGNPKDASCNVAGAMQDADLGYRKQLLQSLVSPKASTKPDTPNTPKLPGAQNTPKDVDPPPKCIAAAKKKEMKAKAELEKDMKEKEKHEHDPEKALEIEGKAQTKFMKVLEEMQEEMEKCQKDEEKKSSLNQLMDEEEGAPNTPKKPVAPNTPKDADPPAKCIAAAKKKEMKAKAELEKDMKEKEQHEHDPEKALEIEGKAQTKFMKVLEEMQEEMEKCQKEEEKKSFLNQLTVEEEGAPNTPKKPVAPNTPENPTGAPNTPKGKLDGALNTMKHLNTPKRTTDPPAPNTPSLDQLTEEEEEDAANTPKEPVAQIVSFLRHLMGADDAPIRSNEGLDE